MATPQRIVRIRRQYNQWVANQTLEDYALRFTAKRARRWSSFQVANTALGAISFLALEAIGGTITISYGFESAVAAIITVGIIIFLTGLPISYYAAKFGVDIDLLTRGAGFGYLGSTVTSLVYASFTFIFFAIEAAIMAMALQLLFGLPLSVGYLACSLAIIPLVTHGITFISRFQLWTQPLWLILHIIPFAFLAAQSLEPFREWTGYAGEFRTDGGAFNILSFGAASAVLFSLMAQIGEQVDFLRFLPRRRQGRRKAWMTALVAAGPGWILLGMIKLLAGSFLAYFALRSGVSAELAVEPTHMYLAAFSKAIASPELALGMAGLFVVISQVKINVTNAYAGSIAWSNFFSRLTHSHPGRVVWLVFNVVIALLLMELGIFKALEQILGLYSVVAVAWVGALVADLVINKPLGLSPRHIEFRRAHLYDINPVGFGAMCLAIAAAFTCHFGECGETAAALSSFVALGTAFLATPAIAFMTNGRYYIARQPKTDWEGKETIRCCICEHDFEHEDMSSCPAYGGPICSLCCSLDARCSDMCKDGARIGEQLASALNAFLPKHLAAAMNSRLSQYLGLMVVVALGFLGAFALIYYQTIQNPSVSPDLVAGILTKLYLILLIAAGIIVWLFVLANESRQVAQEEARRHTSLLLREIAAHQETDKQLKLAKEAAESANLAKSRYVVGLSHELRTPLNAIFGYAQILERDAESSPVTNNAVRVIKRSAEHLAGLIEGLLDISKIEAGRLHIRRNRVALRPFLDQIVDMFVIQANQRGVSFRFEPATNLPEHVFTDEERLRQILINLLSNAVKFTSKGSITLRVRYRNQIAEFDVEDTGVGIREEDLARIFRPFERIQNPEIPTREPGTGLGLTITHLLTEIMGGDISVKSRFGEGTLFTIRLMLSSAPSPDPVEPPPLPIIGYKGERRTVLIADDDPLQRNLIEDALAPLGFSVIGAPNGTACLSMLVQHEPDILLLDISMPGLSGWQVAEKVRQELNLDLPIVMVSADAGDGRRSPALQQHYDGYLIKPVRIDELLKQLALHLDLEWERGLLLEQQSPAPAAPFTREELPEAERIRQLATLGQIGFVRAIEATLDDIDANNANCARFTQHMRRLIKNFELDRFMAILEGIQRHGS